MSANRFSTQKDVEKLYEELIGSAKKTGQRQLLKQINEVCSKLVEQGSTPSAAAVVRILGSMGVKVSKQSIYNKRQGANPYPILIEAWAELVSIKKLGLKTPVGTDSIPIEENDLAEITDPALQHKMKIFLGQYESLRKQNVALREIQQLPLVSPNMESGNTTTSALGAYEKEVISEFLKNLHPSLSFDDEGTLVAQKPIRTGTSLSDPGLKEALEEALGDNLLLNGSSNG